MRIGYYITGHGLGHATRSLGMIKSLVNNGFIVTVVSGIEGKFYLDSLENLQGLECYQKYLDTGAMQNGPLIVDSILTLHSFYNNVFISREVLISNEIAFVKDKSFDLIITDATSIVCRIGNLASIPVVILSNFTWDFCYRKMFESVFETLTSEVKLQFKEMIDSCEEDYSVADLYIKLPGSTPLSEKFKNIKQIVVGPMICRSATKTKSTVRKELGISSTSKVIVLGFGGFKRSAEWLLSDSCLPNNWICVVLGVSSEENKKKSDFFPSDRFIGVPFNYYIPDIINAADAVIGKLGYGTVSECLAHGTPLVYIARSSWPEEKYIEEWITSHNAGVLMPEKDFVNGQWHSYLEECLRRHGTWDPKNFDVSSANEKVIEILKSFLCEKDNIGKLS